MSADTTMNSIRLDGQVAVVTYAIALSQRGAKVVVSGRGSSVDEAELRVVDEINSAGGQAMLGVASVTDRAAVNAMVRSVLNQWGRIDILINNAGFVRDRAFAKCDLDDFQSVLDVHLMGSVNCTKAVWNSMLEQAYGRIVLIISSSGLAGNFGQAAYSAAKMGLVGLMNTLGIEGAKKNVRVNCFSPIGMTRINESFFKPDVRLAFDASKLGPGVVYLASQDAPNRAVLLGGAGSFERAYVTFTRGRHVSGGPEELARRFSEVSDRTGEILPDDASAQVALELSNARGASLE
jgi:NAD(P)-dependent dehydrogenase (short-subunit alcohol dehydrogenase family)